MGTAVDLLSRIMSIADSIQSVLHLCRLMRQGTSCSSQQLFLANSSHKSQFIALLGRRLSEDVHTVHYSLDDVDTLIVKSALEVAEQQQPVTVVAEDTAMPGCT